MSAVQDTPDPGMEQGIEWIKGIISEWWNETGEPILISPAGGIVLLVLLIIVVWRVVRA